MPENVKALRQLRRYSIASWTMILAGITVPFMVGALVNLPAYYMGVMGARITFPLLGIFIVYFLTRSRRKQVAGFPRLRLLAVIIFLCFCIKSYFDTVIEVHKIWCMEGRSVQHCR